MNKLCVLFAHACVRWVVGQILKYVKSELLNFFWNGIVM